ncbi:AAA family ATPase [Sinorhizobium meliloti]|uniref:AAA family ATPase n=1 Tax=Rhizobium meliloti TaxID=382 RepID=UPI000FD3A945|nr:AAA family ATPase [Sinorhizobium meliloti]MDW9823478.1 AAA family ATPase [Sinorhizobium meliloti]MDW9866345.1 AAA family ATPase [Sinorhizobium meliloti]RVG51170.1 recombinase A [Sinorhizobium meliloti]
MKGEDDFPGDRPPHKENVVRFPVKARRYRFRDGKTIPPRPWIMRGLILRKQITSIIAAGGAGKSIFGLCVALHLAAGISFGPFKTVHGPKRVAILTVEEDDDEIDRRLAAIAKHFGFGKDESDRVFIVEIDDPPLLAQVDKRGVIHATDKLRRLEWELGQHGVDVLILDPFIELWSGAENDNGQVKAAVAVIRGVIRRLDAGCLLMHHVKKGLVTPGDIDAGRGAGALGGIVRLAHTITNMTADAAASLGVENPRGIVRVDFAKGNYLPDPGEASWFKFLSIDLENESPPAYPDSDKVGILVAWQPPGLFENLAYEQIDRVLDLIQSADGLEHERYTLAPQSRDRYVGILLVRALDVSEERADRIAKCWKKSGLLYEQEYPGGKSRLKKGVFVDNSKRPSATAET